MNIGEFIRRERFQRGMGLSALARQANVSKGYLHGLEAGKHDPSLSIIQRISEAFGMQAGDLLTLAGYTVARPVIVRRRATIDLTFNEDGTVFTEVRNR
jgi:transcriptional regulator with XRE-family HTH domain